MIGDEMILMLGLVGVVAYGSFKAGQRSSLSLTRDIARAVASKSRAMTMKTAARIVEQVNTHPSDEYTPEESLLEATRFAAEREIEDWQEMEKYINSFEKYQSEMRDIF